MGSATFRVRKYVPQSVTNLRKLQRAVRNVCQLEQHECNLCGFSGKFFPFGHPPRNGASCSRCNSLERHRLVGLWADANTINGARILHFAPELPLTRIFKRSHDLYRTADLNPDAADTVLNIEEIALPDESVDLIICSHVLEHVDDAKALHEMHRILTRGGRAVFMFPIIEGWAHTYENPAHASHADRTKHFGQWDHVRYYGRDVRDRITRAGFSLTEFTAEEPEVSRYGLSRGEKVFVATK